MESTRVVVCYFSVKINVVCQDKNLLNIIALHLAFLVTVFSVVEADADHLPHHGADDEQNAAVHAGNWVVNNHDFILAHGCVIMTAAHKVIEIKEGNKVPFAITEISGDCSIRPHDLIHILLTVLFAQSKTLKT